MSASAANMELVCKAKAHHDATCQRDGDGVSVRPTGSVEIGTSRAITIAIDLGDAGGTQDGINLCVNGGDDYTVTPQGARRIAQALADAADEVERLAEEASVLA